MSERIYVIAEAGVNHNGDLELARRLIEAAAAAGADAVKFQSFKADSLVSRSAPKAPYQLKSTDQSESQYQMIRKLELSEVDHSTLIEHCKANGIEFLSTPFDHSSLSLLANELNVSRIKVSSGDLTNAPLLLAAARTGKPLILSTGMSSVGDIEVALGVLAFGYTKSEEPASTEVFEHAYASPEGQAALRERVTILHCTTEYPAPFADVNLRSMNTLAGTFGLPIGYSDHTVGISIPIAAAALGAAIIEKHFTLDRTLPGPDHKASLEPDELKQMVTAIREIELSLGSTVKRAAPSELKNRDVARKSIVASRDIRKGELFSEGNLTAKRPGGGLHPVRYWDFLGKVAERDYLADEKISS